MKELMVFLLLKISIFKLSLVCRLILTKMSYFRNNPLKKSLFCLTPLLLYGIFFQFENQSLDKLPFKKTSGNIELEKDADGNRPKVDSLILSVKGLANEDLLMKFFEGDFIDIPFDRDSQFFSSLYSAYLNSYARKCGGVLPANKVEMTREECATEQVTRNGYGVELSRYCVEWVTVGTGLYAKPEMYDGKLALEEIQSADVFRNIFGGISQNKGLKGMMDLVVDVQKVIRDMNELFLMNECNSPGLIQFEENLKLFALNKQPHKLNVANDAQPATISTGGSGVYKDQNYLQLIDDLISDHSKGWVMNRYYKGSVSNVSVVARDEKGRPTKVKANYLFEGFSGKSNGAVMLTFTDGLPECMYFFDFPNTCRTPNRRIVAAYDKYAYDQ